MDPGFPSRPLPAGPFRYLAPFIELTSSNAIERPAIEPMSATNRMWDHPEFCPIIC